MLLPANLTALFITGTDTGVGKTFVTALLAKELQKQGRDVGIMKPISAGSNKENDAIFLKKHLKLKDPRQLINPISLRLPLAPYAAAKTSRKKIDLKKVFKAFKALQKLHDIVIVEGVGGTMVPITKGYFVADLIKDLGIPAIIVARAGLGTINHTLLTIECLRKNKVDILGVVINGVKGKEISEKSNAQVIEELSGVPVLAKVRWHKK